MLTYEVWHKMTLLIICLLLKYIKLCRPGARYPFPRQASASSVSTWQAQVMGSWCDVTWRNLHNIRSAFAYIENPTIRPVFSGRITTLWSSHLSIPFFYLSIYLFIYYFFSRVVSEKRAWYKNKLEMVTKLKRCV